MSDELIRFNTIDIRDGQAITLCLKKDILIGYQSYSNRSKEEMKLANPGSEKHINKLKTSIIFRAGGDEPYGVHIVTDSPEDIEKSGIFSYVNITNIDTNKKAKKSKTERLDEV